MAVDSVGIRYEAIEGWERLPAGWSFNDVAGVATDSEDRLYVFNRGEHPVIVFDPEGTVLEAWGEGAFVRPHGHLHHAGRPPLPGRRRRPHGLRVHPRR